MLVDHVYETFEIKDYKIKTLVNKKTKVFNVLISKYKSNDLFELEYEKYLNNPDSTDGSYKTIDSARLAILKFICNTFNSMPLF